MISKGKIGIVGQGFETISERGKLSACVEAGVEPHDIEPERISSHGVEAVCAGARPRHPEPRDLSGGVHMMRGKKLAQRLHLKLEPLLTRCDQRKNPLHNALEQLVCQSSIRSLNPLLERLYTALLQS